MADSHRLRSYSLAASPKFFILEQQIRQLIVDRRRVGILRKGSEELAVATIPKGFLPAQDIGVIVATTDAGPEIPFSKMAALQAKAAEFALNDPSVTGVDSFVGVGVVNSTPIRAA